MFRGRTPALDASGQTQVGTTDDLHAGYRSRARCLGPCSGPTTAAVL